MRKKTDEEFKKEVYSLVKDDYNFLEPYINSNSKLLVKHNKCKNTYKVTPNCFLHGRRCPFCSGNKYNKS